MNDGVLSAIGNTPLVRLSRVIPDARFKLYAKLEGLNPGGSTKPRPAFSILRHAIDTGEVQPDTVEFTTDSVVRIILRFPDFTGSGLGEVPGG